MTCKTSPDRDSIFGNTYCGVPNPLVPHKHPYPTRYHGAMLTQVQATLPYRPRPFARGPYTLRAKPLQPWERPGSAVSGLGDGYQGSDNLLVSAVLGGVVGAAISPPRRRGEQLLWVAGGAIANGVAGPVGLAALSFLALYRR